MAYEWVQQNVLASTQLQARTGAEQVGYVTNLYEFVLGRVLPPRSELQYWVYRLPRVGALQVVLEIWYSEEGVQRRLNDNVLLQLNRGVDFESVGYWYPREVRSDIDLKVELAVTPEYRDAAEDLFA